MATTEKNKAILLIFFTESVVWCKSQDNILDSLFTFTQGTVKTGTALNLITRQSGFNFTYDSRLIDAEKKTDLKFRNIPLRNILVPFSEMIPSGIR
jgi:hypothetical protein